MGLKKDHLRARRLYKIYSEVSAFLGVQINDIKIDCDDTLYGQTCPFVVQYVNANGEVTKTVTVRFTEHGFETLVPKLSKF